MITDVLDRILSHDQDVLTVEQAADLMGIGRDSLYDAIGRHEVPHRRIGRTIRLSRRGLLRWLAGE